MGLKIFSHNFKSQDRVFWWVVPVRSFSILLIRIFSLLHFNFICINEFLIIVDYRSVLTY